MAAAEEGGSEVPSLENTDPSLICNINIGVLGHIDSGKTSLVRALSQITSTASLDKSPQSTERKITLDLGFSSFYLPPPDGMPGADPYALLQFTLVDCPGHAPLIKTIIGGAQIIDLMLLVVDVTKGFQAQTAEGLVIGELTTDTLIVVLNKADCIPASSRAKKVEKMKKRVAKTLSQTRFAGAPMVVVSANPRVDAGRGTGDGSGGGGDNEEDNGTVQRGPPEGIEEFLETLMSVVRIPERVADGPFLFSVDHAFVIRGVGPVLTGTVVTGSARVGDEIVLPSLGLTTKVKSMQMFRKPVSSARQGDRVGICVKDREASRMERGLACSEGAVSTLTAAVASVERIRFFQGNVGSGTKFHVTFGHTTVMAKVRFFSIEPDGIGSLARRYRGGPGEASTSETPATTSTADSTAAGEVEAEEGDAAGSVGGSRPDLTTVLDLDPVFDFDSDYLDRDDLEDTSSEFPPGSQFALLEFERPLVCPQHAAVLGSRFDTEAESGLCRLAFQGRILAPIDPAHKDVLRVYIPRSKTGNFFRIEDEHNVICKDLFSRDTDFSLYKGMAVVSSADGAEGTITNSFGASNKFRVHFPAGGQTRKARVVLHYKRYVFDKSKTFVQ